MKGYLYWLLLGAWSVIGFLAGEPALWARGPHGGIVELGSLKSRVPAYWVEVSPDSARWQKQYRLEPVNDDKEPARLTVSSLGKGKGPNAVEYVMARLEMWFPPAGKTMRQAAKVRELSVRGASVTYLDVRGDYKGIPGNDTTPRQNYRLLGVYFDTPKGAYLVCLFGPADTLGFYRHEFEDFVKAFK
jgi:hypothetical protein